MSYDDLKSHEGETYTGMPVGAGHVWDYPDGTWRETKTSPEEWRLDYTATKVRSEPAPPGSGADPGTRYHWLIVAGQLVEKLDKDRYATVMSGRKWKLGHKRPHWRRFSYGYEDQPSREERIRAVLEELLDDGEVIEEL